MGGGASGTDYHRYGKHILLIRMENGANHRDLFVWGTMVVIGLARTLYRCYIDLVFRDVVDIPRLSLFNWFVSRSTLQMSLVFTVLLLTQDRVSKV
uniref:Uncharacterized protein n=1 Tax=Candidatus Kentrum sp. MB TaxID=2138164 RepID=A0A451BCY1_9GAMM|nr:MAG: hypothetical protein BECKMB1821I_GA0114274_10449 [Candidatus Kentron sp. MB]VFK76128.1 MAG: hypothetical protein BECKMB1821H_GA0114242_10438 [Candidatus Kentron sp. MB]